MHARIARLPAALVTADQDRDLEREFEARLVECSTLAFRVAYSVLRHHQARRDGTVRDTVMYSILAAEWRDVKRHLERRLLRED